MKTAKYVMVVGLLLTLGMLVSACGAELNPKFEGSLASALDAKKGDFKGCYEKALKKDREAKGNVKINLEFKPDSKKAQDAKVVKSDIDDKKMNKCVCNAAKSVETTELPGMYVDAKYTVNFDFE